MTKSEKLADALKWFAGQSEAVKQKAFEQLLEFAIDAEWIGVWRPDDRQELSAESGKPLSDYEAPYFRTCGEPLGK